MVFTRNIKSSTKTQKTIQGLPNRYFNAKTTLKMPLVVPGINSGGDNSKTQEWTDKLVGKKIGDTSDAVVSIVNSLGSSVLMVFRLLPRQTFPERPELSSQA
jgi:hypothetical protein